MDEIARGGATTARRALSGFDGDAGDRGAGGLLIVLFGLIAAMAGRIWVENRVDFSNPRNLITVAAALTAGAGDLTLKFGAFTMGGIGTATFGAIILYQILAWNNAKE